jgi:hypothetical protein
VARERPIASDDRPSELSPGPGDWAARDLPPSDRAGAGGGSISATLADESYERVTCDACGRFFITEQPGTMLAALTGTCSCGGRFSRAGASTKSTGNRAPSR